MTKFLLPALIAVLCPAALAQWTQQGGEIDFIGGLAVAVSADGNTAVFGYPDQRNGKGQTTVYIRANGSWSQQGGTLIGSGASGNSRQGESVAISADGNTILVGGGADVTGGVPAGAAWVFTRSNGVWTQQGNKLTGSGATSTGSQFGFAVGLSADGNTALISGPGDGYNPATGLTAGAAWFFTRSGGVWTQQGSKQVPAGAPLYAGVSAALSGDGATAILGSPYDGTSDPEDYGPGALWVFTRSGSTWSQQGGKLTASGTVGDAALGLSVALSSDGSTAIAGASFDNSDQGSAWVFVRNSGVWSQQGGKLFGAGVVGSFAAQGQSVAISGDGNTAVVGGPADDTGEGAAWTFRRQSGVWGAFGGKLVGAGDANGNSPEQGYAVAISSDASTLISCGNFLSGGGVAFVFTSSAVSTVNLTLQTAPAGLRVSLDGGAFTTAPLTASLATGSQHTIAVQTPQSGATGTQYVFTGWSDSGAASHTITVGSAAATYTASLKTQYQLTTSASPAAGGSVTPASGGFYDSGSAVPISATANSGFTFANWTGSVANANSASTTVTMSAAQTVTANFSSTSGITIQTIPTGLQFTIDGGAAQTAPRTLSLSAGTHTLAVATTQAGAAGTQYVFTSWSDSGAASHTITVGAAAATYTASFKTQYQLTVTASPAAGGLVSPSAAVFYDAGTSVPVSATANSGYTFSNWIGSVANPNSASTTVTMSAAEVLVAMFHSTTVTGSRFVPVTPCRVVDTRGLTPPVMTGNSTRTFSISTSTCPSLPATAQAYSVNVTVVPSGPLAYLTIWPTGQPQPFVSTLNAYDGNIVANAALVPAGANGSVNVYVTDATHVIIDINGYFDSQNGQPFFTTTPCRVVDTRGNGLTGAFGTPSMGSNQTRTFPAPSSNCGLPSGAAAYSLNATVVPPGPLGYLTAWPAGQVQPVVSTLNALDGRVVANAAIVPAGAAGAVSVFVTDPTDLILDANGYFAGTGTGTPLAFYPVTPCRVVDTRGAAGLFGGPSIGGGASRSFAIPQGACNIPANAQAYSVNVTAVPSGPLIYLTAWPSGQAQPTVSTLNSFAGKVVANAAIVPAGAGGAVSVFVSNPSDVILDINGYFAQ